MALVNYKTRKIEIELADRVIADTVIKQKAKFISLYHSQNETDSFATITVTVSLYSADNGVYGAELTGAGFSSYNVVLIADNNTIVNAQTGAILLIRSYESNEVWKATAEQFTENVMFQGDFFEMLRDTQSINIGDLIKQHITQANEMGKFN